MTIAPSPTSTAATVTTPARGFAGAIKDGLFAGLIALGVFGPLIGFKTVADMQNRLVLETRWGLLAIIVMIVAAGRFLISVYHRRTADAAPRARFVLPAALSKGLPPAALVVCFV
ncbi:MAG: DUF3382 domain-containing protein, partial [Phreatobacter sp.]